MGLDQAILMKEKGTNDMTILMEFHKHSRLHGFMERLCYQKGLIDPFEQVDVDWKALEHQIKEDIEAQIESREIIVPEGEGVDASNPFVVAPTIDIQPYFKGRLTPDFLVPLEFEDFGLLLEAFAQYADAETQKERDGIFPPCEGFFFGESTKEEWLKTIVLIQLIDTEIGWDTHDFFYVSNF